MCTNLLINFITEMCSYMDSVHQISNTVLSDFVLSLFKNFIMMMILSLYFRIEEVSHILQDKEQAQPHPTSEIY